ncbi:branched-chain amino acid ABC transporter permease [Haloarchaeobius sp. HME9146]|uniref:branched-chain amino acid ABC transporter permease n=1 Tax=Haloarchaeobius sp. HME9146 TaxID=2978732 RepID=UPI0021C21353|nr:branched-chain amino acid ABC transporter permease [Haloarchaeobius sp. HME9146]MCT9096753.1 branched-chain amino acid ABC transporter permease [Haloarchaeobius sp. HME9146]
MSVVDSMKESVADDSTAVAGIAVAAAAVLLLLALGVLKLPYVLRTLAFGGAWVLLTMGLNVQWGYTGLINFSVAAFWGVGAYSVALLTSPNSPLGLELHPVFGFLTAIVVSAFIAVLIGIPTLKLREDYLAIASLGLAEVIRLVIRNEDQWTAGSSGISRIPRLFEGLPLTQEATNLAVVAVLIGAVYLLLRRMQRSPWGRVLRTIRSDEDLAKALGKNTFNLKMQAFVLGSVIMAIAGAFYVHLNLYIDPTDLVPLTTFYIWVAVILGGTASNRGSILGGMTIIAILEGTRFFPSVVEWTSETLGLPVLLDLFQGIDVASLRLLLVGLLIILVVRYKPAGLLPPRSELIWPGAQRSGARPSNEGDSQ